MGSKTSSGPALKLYRVRKEPLSANPEITGLADKVDFKSFFGMSRQTIAYIYKRASFV